MAQTFYNGIVFGNSKDSKAAADLWCLRDVSGQVSIARRASVVFLGGEAIMHRFTPFVVGLVNICQTVPSLAVLALFVGILGIGSRTAIFALWIYSLLPILNNTIAGINSVDPAIKDSGRGMGMTKLKLLGRVELPLAMSVIMAGIRTAVVINVATAVVAAYVGGGGLGDIIIAGKNINRWQAWSLGAIYATCIALLLDHILGVVERVMSD